MTTSMYTEFSNTCAALCECAQWSGQRERETDTSACFVDSETLTRLLAFWSIVVSSKDGDEICALPISISPSFPLSFSSLTLSFLARPLCIGVDSLLYASFCRSTSETSRPPNRSVIKKRKITSLWQIRPQRGLFINPHKLASRRLSTPMPLCRSEEEMPSIDFQGCKRRFRALGNLYFQLFWHSH